MSENAIAVELRQPEAAAMTPYEDANFGAFHLRVLAASIGGVFSDGFGLGVVGIALGAAATQLGLTPHWQGLIAAGSLTGLFVGALLTGPVADRFGRRPVYAYNMAVLAIVSGLQFFVTSAGQLLALRLVIGFVLGTDYVVSKALLTEFSPRRVRGRIMSTLSIAWAAGYVCAYFAGYMLIDAGPAAWRLMLVLGAVPALIVLPMRLTMPESPLWLIDRGRAVQAAGIISRHVGLQVAPPARSAICGHGWPWYQLVSPAWRRRTLVGCVFFTGLVIPYFAVGTFVPNVLTALHVENGYLGGMIYNLFLLVGTVLGLLVADHLPRRTFLLGGFTVTSGALTILILWKGLPSTEIIVLFALYAGVLSASQSLVYVYLPELFPTELRAAGIGVAIAASRLGSALSTYLLPEVSAAFGVRVALGGCVVAMLCAALVCWKWAPETRNRRLDTLATIR